MFNCKCGDNKCPGPNARPKPPTPKGSVGLVPLVFTKGPHAMWVSNCTKLGRKVCYQGPAAGLARVVKLDPCACKPGGDHPEATLVNNEWYDTDPGYDTGFGELLGNDPFFPNVKLFGCGDTCARPGDLECFDQQGRTHGAGTYCVGPPQQVADGTRRNHTIITCEGNPGGEASGYLVLWQGHWRPVQQVAVLLNLRAAKSGVDLTSRPYWSSVNVRQFVV